MGGAVHVAKKASWAGEAVHVTGRAVHVGSGAVHVASGAVHATSGAVRQLVKLFSSWGR
jgi:hypothetical protein